MKNLTATICLTLAVLLGNAGVSASAETNTGPSFDCDRASTPTEYAICASETLSTLDRALAAAYKVAKGNIEKESENLTTLRDEQRQWNKKKSSTCGDDAECLSHTNCSIDDRESANIWNYDLEVAFNFGKEVKKLIKENNLEGLFDLVEGELTNGPRKQFIKGKKFSDIFSNDWRNDLLTSDTPCSPLGWRGFMLAGGSIWYECGKLGCNIFTINGAGKEDISIDALEYIKPTYKLISEKTLGLAKSCHLEGCSSTVEKIISSDDGFIFTYYQSDGRDTVMCDHKEVYPCSTIGDEGGGRLEIHIKNKITKEKIIIKNKGAVMSISSAPMDSPFLFLWYRQDCVRCSGSHSIYLKDNLRLKPFEIEGDITPTKDNRLYYEDWETIHVGDDSKRKTDEPYFIEDIVVKYFKDQ
jgi:uncharacterized protein YecT (DUF1311 family)